MPNNINAFQRRTLSALKVKETRQITVKNINMMCSAGARFRLKQYPLFANINRDPLRAGDGSVASDSIFNKIILQ